MSSLSLSLFVWSFHATTNITIVLSSNHIVNNGVCIGWFGVLYIDGGFGYVNGECPREFLWIYG